MLWMYFSNVSTLDMVKEISALSERGVCDRPEKQKSIRQAQCKQFCGCEANFQAEALHSTLNIMRAVFGLFNLRTKHSVGSWGFPFRWSQHFIAVIFHEASVRRGMTRMKWGERKHDIHEPFPCLSAHSSLHLLQWF